MNGNLNGIAYLQNFPSLVAGHVLNPQAGDCVLDACAAPGGKTCHLASLMNHSGLLVACDCSVAKVDLIARNLAQFSSMSQDSVFVCKGDSSVMPTSTERAENPKDALLKVLKGCEEIILSAPGGQDRSTARRLIPGSLPIQCFVSFFGPSALFCFRGLIFSL